MGLKELKTVLTTLESQFNEHYVRYPKIRALHTKQLAACLYRLNNLAKESHPIDDLILQVQQVLQGVYLCDPIRFSTLKKAWIEPLDNPTQPLRISLTVEIKAIVPNHTTETKLTTSAPKMR